MVSNVRHELLSSFNADLKEANMQLSQLQTTQKINIEVYLNGSLSLRLLVNATRLIGLAR